MYSAYNHPALDYKSVLEILKERSETNTSQTSSLPLAAFWYPKRNKVQKDKLFQGIGIRFDGLNPQDTEYNFEYPTPAFENKESQKIIDRSVSWTDLMIRLNGEKGTRITIEAKYTEYVKGKNYDPLEVWSKDKKHGKEILQCWIDYINDNGCGSIPRAEELLNNDKWRELPYQFLHRTASACFNCKHPILVYQLFYDNTKESTDKLKDFKKLLSDWAKELQLKLPFFIVETEVKKRPDPAEWNKYKKNPSELFIKMIDNENLYTFGEITVHKGYDF